METSLIEEFYYPKYGPGQLWETVAKRFQDAGGLLLTGKEVTVLERRGNTVTAALCADGSRFPAEYALSSMPLQQLIPALGDAPNALREIAAGLPYRDFVTVGLLVDALELAHKYLVSKNDPQAGLFADPKALSKEALIALREGLLG